MPVKSFAAVALPVLAVLSLLSPGTAVAGPPEGVAARMVLDEVADGMRKYRKETETPKRLAWLRKLAATGDPRVAVLLAEAARNHDDGEVDCEAADELWWHYASPDAVSRRGIVNRQDRKPPTGLNYRAWWKANEAEMRRRARQLPQ
jgi:hypothetical protein